MTILVTGVTGLVGRRLVPRLIEAGRECRVLMRSYNNPPDNVEVVIGDMLEPATLARAVRGVSAVIHLAAVFRTHDQQLIWKSNLDGTRNLLKAVREHAPQSRFILASTGRIYETDLPRSRPGREDDPVQPTHAYPASKLAAEQLVRESKLTWAIIRFPFVYGDGDGHIEMLPAHAGTFKWHPASRMSTIHHRDVATAMTLALDGVMDGRVVNVADDLPASMLELLALAGGRMEASAEPLNNPWASQYDTALARSLGFKPTVRTVYAAAQQGII
ncbi:NAD(P)-dependent oxidoreductase [Neorhizobium sp. NCHU2750]|uniref:NAD-dependent epimerase/dehydratase family protein n=1 Tax=Neorhizobium sp. NCHU2750 TaxID=1825976 RepID=UPI000E7604B4|nr:epimerase [Neorhizobium sp. NCHU2750]